MIYPENIAYYYHAFKIAIETKIAAQVFNSYLTQEKIQDIVSVANDVYVCNLQNNAAKIIQVSKQAKRLWNLLLVNVPFNILEMVDANCK